MAVVRHVASSSTSIACIMSSSFVIALLIFGSVSNGYHYYNHTFTAYAAYTKATVASGGPTLNDPNLKVEALVKGLDVPTSMAFLGPDDILVLEKNTLTGSLYHFKLNQQREGLSLTGPLADKVANTPEESQQAALGHGFGTITDLQIGPDGYLYVITFSGSLYRIVPSSSSSSNSLTPHDKVSESSNNNRNTQSPDSSGRSDNSSPGVLHGAPNSDNNNDNTSSNHNSQKNLESTTPGKLVEEVEPSSIVGGSR
jgi:hypothetical protein